MEKLTPTDPRWTAALDELSTEIGMDIRQVLLPTHYTVVVADGTPQVVVNAEGMRALALTAPRPDAQEVAEEIITAAEAAHRDR